EDLVGDGGGGLDDLDTTLAFEALLDDVHVQEAEEAAAKAEAESLGVDGHEREGGVVEGEFLHGLAEAFEVVLGRAPGAAPPTVLIADGGGVEITEDHLHRGLVARKGLLCRV